MLGASVLALWPDDACVVDRAIASVVAGRLRKDPGDPYPSLRETTSTRHATYRVGDAAAGADVVDGHPTLSFRLVTAAVPALEAAGADCYGPQQLPCRGPGGNSRSSTAPRPAPIRSPPPTSSSLLRSRRDGAPFVGIVAQPVVVVEPLRPLGPLRSGAVPVHVSVGVPLLDP